MSEGVKYDNDKPRWGLLPFKQVEEVVDVLTFGSTKYADDNWKKVPNAKERYFDAMHRHLAEYRYGDRLDSETNKSHLAHAVCCILFQMWFDDNNSIPEDEPQPVHNIRIPEGKPIDPFDPLDIGNKLKSNPFEFSTFIHVQDSFDNPFNTPQEGVIHNINNEIENNQELTDCTHIPHKEGEYVYIGSLCPPFKFEVIADENLHTSVLKLNE